MEIDFENIDMPKSSFDLLFDKPIKQKFINLNFDFEINPDHFIEWLKKEDIEVTGDYKIDVGSMCEYACLYISMMLCGKKLKGDLKIYYGQFGFWEHFWMGYKINGEEYFIDLTLMQFDEDAPKLATTKATNERTAGSYSSLSEGEPIKLYLKRQKAFKFYTNPHTMVKPKLGLHSLSELQEIKFNIECSLV